MEFAFTVRGPPVPNQRARMGAGGRFYTPHETRSYRKRVVLDAFAAMATKGLLARGQWPLDAHYSVRLRICPFDHRRMDGDNVLKTVQDACTGLVWKDDSQVKESIVQTVAPNKERAGVTVTVKVLAAVAARKAR